MVNNPTIVTRGKHNAPGGPDEIKMSIHVFCKFNQTILILRLSVSTGGICGKITIQKVSR